MNFKYKIGTLLYLYKCTYFVSVWPSFSQWANLVQNRYTYFVPILYPEIVPILYFILVWVYIYIYLSLYNSGYGTLCGTVFDLYVKHLFKGGKKN